MELRMPSLTRTGEAECEAGYERFARLASAAGEADQLVASLGHDPLDRPLDASRRHAEVLGDLTALMPVAVQSDHLALTLGETREHGVRHGFDLGVRLTREQHLLRCRIFDGGALERRGSDVRKDFTPRTSLHVSQLAMRGGTEPGENFTLRLPATPTLSPETGFLERLVDLVPVRVGVPRRDLRAQLRAELSPGDLLDQSSREVLVGAECVRYRHQLYRGRRTRIGPPLGGIGAPRVGERPPVGG
jgi:hypothetical protein